MNAGFCGSAPILTMASSRVARTLGLAGLLKPMWLSEIWRNVNPLAAAFASEIPSIDDRGTPPDTVHNTPVPAQSMHSKAPRLLTPSFSSSDICLSSVVEWVIDKGETKTAFRLFPTNDDFLVVVRLPSNSHHDRASPSSKTRIRHGLGRRKIDGIRNIERPSRVTPKDKRVRSPQKCISAK